MQVLDNRFSYLFYISSPGKAIDLEKVHSGLQERASLTFAVPAKRLLIANFNESPRGHPFKLHGLDLICAIWAHSKYMAGQVYLQLLQRLTLLICLPQGKVN